MNKNGRVYYKRLLMKKKQIFFAFTVLLLSGCANNIARFSIPEKIVFQDQAYTKVTSNQLGEMQHLLYLAENEKKDPEDWDKGILLFLDKNSTEQTLEQRAAFRRSNFADKPDIHARIEIKDNELQSQITYPPTKRFNNVMLEVTRGRNLTCGYGQIQFSDKKKIAKKSPNLTAYSQEIAKLSQAFNQMIWQIGCK